MTLNPSNRNVSLTMESITEARFQSTVQFYTVGTEAYRVINSPPVVVILSCPQVCVCSLGSLAPPQAPQGQSASFHETFSAQEKSSCKQREWSIGHFDQ